MDVLRKQEILPQLPKLDKYERKSSCGNTWQGSLSETESWREKLRYLTDYRLERGRFDKDTDFLSTFQPKQNEVQRNNISFEFDSDKSSRKTDFPGILTERPVLLRTNQEPDVYGARLRELSAANAEGERNVFHEDKTSSSQSKLPSFEIFSAIGQKEDIPGYQGGCLRGETVLKTAAVASPQIADRNSRVSFHDGGILQPINSPTGFSQPRNDNNSYKTSSSEENLYSIRQLPWSEYARTRNYDCVEPSLGVSISDEQRRFGENALCMSVSQPMYEEPHPLVTLRSTEGLTQEQKQLRRILKNRWSAKMSRMKRNEQIRRLEFKSSEQEKIIRELLEERDSLKNEISLLKKQVEQQQSENVAE
ncbi:hypothetical protein Gasu2_27120 [Galdieria sulphuraria]|uniref:BZIP domain-containing protein n=1 Tax=Galdieria sulphuraria TaxID=130081 RepID=M2X1K1_GALSU|nr:uncharacterized protein Gasu_23940 [Galdieria sulphuraria]EME30240.1 hypothetical protein Gasu_23940 [Galdieria sulphuraria]GJD08408.1 hypothetical protein Gasu2_27120 [Galdieria sulphuraria]|eukprot:XP_005706760.1 hypothetical protein Gasu_23940 [Galdieria sulphuraria]